ncbi:MAG: hypothetical protein KAI63_02885, partial [Planctomycetes bacterium]|nr:hypothetical protein [Planctomycetota bacterium]
MHQLLLELNQEVGVQGSMVVSPDGIIIDAALDVFLSQDLMAAMASTAITNLKNSLAKADIK